MRQKERHIEGQRDRQIHDRFTDRYKNSAADKDRNTSNRQRERYALAILVVLVAGNGGPWFIRSSCSDRRHYAETDTP